MKYEIMINILFDLLTQRKLSASYLAKKYEVSVRSIYRYVDEMTVAGIPIDVMRGANGGVYIPDSFKLPRGLLSREEYARTAEALLAMYEQTHDPVLESARGKLTAQMKAEKFDTALSGNIIVDCGTWGDERRFSDKLTVLQQATEKKEALSIEYFDRTGETTRRTIQPYVLIYKQNIWYVWAFCTLRGEFRTFRVGRMRTIRNTGETFERKPFTREDITLNFWRNEKIADVKLKISPEKLPYAEDWLGVDNIYKKDGEYFAELILPDDAALVGNILSAGAGMTVLSPLSLAEKVKKEAEKIAASYAKD